MDPYALEPVTRRGFVQVTGASLAAVAMGRTTAMASAAEQSATPPPAGSDPRPFLTPAADFVDVSRGDPKPHRLGPAAQVEARLTAETWRLEVVADPFVEEPHTRVPAALGKPLTLEAGTALDLPALEELGRRHQVHFLKAMQCLNIDTPLGQGLWTGVPLRAVLGLCGPMDNVRRINFWGYHNNDPKQIFRSSVSYTQCMETPPGELPVFLAYRLNGEPIPLTRGGPVRMVVPWSHGYKSIKWLQHIAVTNDPRNSDTYANGNNDPDSYLKTAAYIDAGPKTLQAGDPVVVTGLVISGPSGVARVEYWVRRIEAGSRPLTDDDPELLRGPWKECRLEEPPDWSSLLPGGVQPRDILGFDRRTGEPTSWPTRYGMCSYEAVIRGLEPGRYEVRARSVDLNGLAQPEPRPAAKTGRNAIQVREFEVV